MQKRNASCGLRNSDPNSKNGDKKSKTDSPQFVMRSFVEAVFLFLTFLAVLSRIEPKLIFKNFSLHIPVITFVNDEQ